MQTPEVILPVTQINGSSDTLQIAKDMDDVEFRALVINTFRLVNDIAPKIDAINEFCLMFGQIMNAIGENPMARAMMPPGLIAPGMNPAGNRATRRGH